MLDIVTFTLLVNFDLVDGHFCTINILELCSWVEVIWRQFDPFEACFEAFG